MLILFLIVAGRSTFAQDHLTDSLKQILSARLADTTRIHTLNTLAYRVYRTNPDEAITYGMASKDLALKINFRKGLAEAYEHTGLGYYMQGNYTEALKNWEASLELFTELGENQLVADLLSNMGSVYYATGEHVEAIDYSLRALEMAERLGDTARIGSLMLNIGEVYADQASTLDSALSYYTRTIQLAEISGDNDMRGRGTVNLAEAFIEQGEYDTALYYFEKALTILTNPVDIASSLNFIGNLHVEQGDYAQAVIYFNDALEKLETEDAQREVVSILLSLARTFEVQEQHERAIDYYKRAEDLAADAGLNEELSGAYVGLAENYAELLDFTNAYKYLSLHNTINNAIYRIESENQSRDLINTYHMDKKEAEIEILEQRSEIEQLKGRRQKAIILSTGLLGILLLAVVLGLNNRMNYIRKTNEKINAQNNLITDSITYAQRIQTAILPSKGLLDQVMPEHFMLLKPKDIVSGDFFWIKEVQDHLVIVGADCTGHGVPGAFMSMLGITLLNDLIGDHCYHAPCDILEQLRRKLKETLYQNGDLEEQKDGMDMALVIINTTTRELHFAGANTPLYLIRKKNAHDVEDLHAYASAENNEYQLYEIKGDKQPIGVHWEERSFTNHSFRLKAHDSLYIFSDGYVDQFGGKFRKKFKSMNFKRLLLSLQDTSMEHQKRILDDSFEDWRGEIEQIDDVSVIGLRV